MRIALLALLPLLCACTALGGSPVVFHFEVNGDADVLTDVEHAVILGDATGTITARAKGSPIPILVYPFVNQTGDVTLVDGGEAHHHAFLSEFMLPAKSLDLFTPALLAKYPDLKFSSE